MFEALVFSPVGTWVRESVYAYPALEVLHILGIGMLFGSAAFLDLRILGLARAVELRALYRYVVPVSLSGFLLILLSGLLLFTAQADHLAEMPLFRVKLILIVVGGLNAWGLHRLHMAGREEEPERLPRSAKFQAVASLGIWIAVITCGRFLAYVY